MQKLKKIFIKSPSDNPTNACYCHSESFGKLRACPELVEGINFAKNLIFSGTYMFEILRLAPQNDIVGQPPNVSSTVLP